MSIWQTKSWQEMLVVSKQTEQFFVVDDVYVEKRRLSLWEYWLFVLWLEKEKSRNLEKKLIDLCKQENCLFVQVENLFYDSLRKVKWIGIFKKGYYKKFITPYTAVIDLMKEEEEILAKMKPKGRYNIRLAEKKWIDVFEAEKTRENIELFYNLMKETALRDLFSGNCLEYYKIFLKEIKNSKLFLAKVQSGEIVAWGIFIFGKDVSIYYYWASSSEKQYRNLMAPYLLQWEAIKIAKAFWSKIYDFLWVASPQDKNSSLSWITDFKMKLTSDVREVSSAFIYVNKKLKYAFISMLRKILK
jgi:lipid II:glycine glycyltransferase (peptidoglycan interpeptide bridge formation enzyme)